MQCLGAVTFFRGYLSARKFSQGHIISRVSLTGGPCSLSYKAQLICKLRQVNLGRTLVPNLSKALSNRNRVAAHSSNLASHVVAVAHDVLLILFELPLNY